MSNLLDVADTDSDKFIVGRLPPNSGDISLMTLEQLYIALGGSIREREEKCDPLQRLGNSEYYVYALNDTNGVDDALSKSTITNLEAIDANWYKQLNKPDTFANHWIVGDYKVFGGPLHDIKRYSNGTYDFSWYYSEHLNDCSVSGGHWRDSVSGSVYVAVVHS